MDEERKIVSKIRELANAKGMSQNHLADFTGLSRAHLSRIMNLKQSPSIKTLKRICDTLEVHLGQLFEDL
ncbi:MAG: helix-turn-helix transcriptional regulator [Pseudomonadota bacterium]